MVRIRELQKKNGFSYNFAEQAAMQYLKLGLVDIKCNRSYEIYCKNKPLLDLVRVIWGQVAKAGVLDISKAFDILDDDDLVLAGFENIATIGRRL